MSESIPSSENVQVAFLSSVERELNELVEDGKITQEQAGEKRLAARAITEFENDVKAQAAIFARADIAETGPIQRY